ncbi:MAG TPA: hypothetical protein VFQ91_24570 [Bryobacteraceae bacterium]|nr:hypothetical protein [Bryobacteraceae bacterium]
MPLVRIAGAGLAGSAAALSALREGAGARMWDPSRIPKHKVCGEFLTPEAAPVLAGLGLWDAFQELRPARMQRLRLIFGTRAVESRLPEPSYGISRYRLDALLRGEAEARGAQWIVERVPGLVDVVAHGRQSAAEGRNRLFGFKAHFSGPVSDAVELYFFDGLYVGVNPVENGYTNVCGLGSEERLRQLQFDYDALLTRNAALADRLRPLTRTLEWLSTGPLVYHSQLANPPAGGLLAGDALQFIDPFTGTGMTTALWSGALAGRSVALGLPREAYYAEVAAGLDRQQRWCRRLRGALERGWPLHFAPYLPPQWLYGLTRPQIESR